jgi:hypothetical protein
MGVLFVSGVRRYRWGGNNRNSRFGFKSASVSPQPEQGKEPGERGPAKRLI